MSSEMNSEDIRAHYFFTITLHLAVAPLFIITLIVTFPFLLAFTTPFALILTIVFLPITLYLFTLSPGVLTLITMRFFLPFLIFNVFFARRIFAPCDPLFVSSESSVDDVCVTLPDGAVVPPGNGEPLGVADAEVVGFVGSDDVPGLDEVSGFGVVVPPGVGVGVGEVPGVGVGVGVGAGEVPGVGVGAGEVPGVGAGAVGVALGSLLGLVLGI